MNEGVNAVTAKGGKAATWTNAALAARFDGPGREGAKAKTSPNMIANWRKGKFLPANVEPLIVAIYGDPPDPPGPAVHLRKLYRDALAEKLEHGATALRRKSGNLFAVVNDQAVLDAAPRRTDLAQARDLQQRTLQEAVRRDAEALASRLARVEDDGTAAEIAGLAGTLRDIAALEPQPLVKRLTALFVVVTRIGGYNKGESLKRGETGRNPPLLPAQDAGGLSALAALAYAWALSFPACAKLDALAARQEFAADAEDAAAWFEAARSENVISADDAETLGAMTQSGHPGTKPSQTQQALAGRHGADLAAISYQGIARFASGDSDAEPFARRSLAALQRAPQAVEKFGGSELAGDALRLGVDLAGQLPAAELPVPVDVEAQAEKFILKGIAPPAHWRPHIRGLSFIGEHLADAAPLAGLTALTSLDLAHTEIADAAPLAGLTALTSLTLMNTQIADAAPLAGLTALTSLDLSYTKIADATPMAGLTALTRLDLAATAIVDLTPLAGLTALKWLDLSHTRVADLSPLAALPNLKTLRLEIAPDADLAPLAGLIANGLEILGKDVPAKLRPKRKTRPPVRPPKDRPPRRPHPRNP